MPSLKKKFNLVIILLIFIPSVILIIITNLLMKNIAYQEAYNKMEIMVIRTNAIHQYLNEIARPVIFEMMEQHQVPSSFFRPEIMSSTYAVREINKIFLDNITTDYYFKEIAINPRNPENQADDFEAEILKIFNEDRTKTEYQAREMIDGKPFFRYIKKGEILKDSCMTCHSQPELAPQDLLNIYGEQRGFHRQIDEVVSVQSIMIPLADAYQTANRMSLTFGVILIAFMSGVAVFLSNYTDRLFFARVDKLKQHFSDIISEKKEINEQVIDMRSDEISQLNNYFSQLATKVYCYEKELEAERSLLKVKVEQQTSSLVQSNQLLKQEMANSNNYADEIESQRKKLEEAYGKISENIIKARQMHQRFFPENLSDIENYSFASYYQPSEYLGGDFYNVIHIGNRLLFYITDVTGHGLDGAMITVFVRETINSFLSNNSDRYMDFTPGEILKFLENNYCLENFPDDYFICIFLGIINLENNEFKFTNAGMHEPPLILPDKGPIKQLDCKGLPISKMLVRDEFEEETIIIYPGDMIFLTTDGIIEETRESGSYGIERLKRVLTDCRYMSPSSVVEAVREDFAAFAGSVLISDDVTFLVIRYQEQE